MSSYIIKFLKILQSQEEWKITNLLNSVDLKKVYERVTQTVAVDESSFIMYLNETVNELIGKYRPRYVVLPDTVFSDIDSLDGTANVYGVYSQCIADNIVYNAMNGGINSDQNKKQDFLNRAQQAYITVYRELSKDLRVAPMNYHTGRW